MPAGITNSLYWGSHSTLTQPKEAPSPEAKGFASLFSDDFGEFHKQISEMGYEEQWKQSSGGRRGGDDPVLRKHLAKVIFLKSQGYGREDIKSGNAQLDFAARTGTPTHDEKAILAKMAAMAGVRDEEDESLKEFRRRGAEVYMMGGKLGLDTQKEIDKELAAIEDPEMRRLSRRAVAMGIDKARQEFPRPMLRIARNIAAELRFEAGAGSTTGGQPLQTAPALWDEIFEEYDHYDATQKNQLRLAVRTILKNEVPIPQEQFGDVTERVKRTIGEFYHTTAAGVKGLPKVGEVGEKLTGRDRGFHSLKADMWKMYDDSGAPLWDRESAGPIREGWESAVKSSPFFALAMLGGAPGMALGGVYESEATMMDLNERFPDADMRSKQHVAWATGAVNMLIERLQAKHAISLFKFGKGMNLRKVLNEAGMAGLRRKTAALGFRTGMVLGGEFLEESIQDMSQPIFTAFKQWLGDEYVDEEGNPFQLTKELKKIWLEESATRFWAVAPLAIFGVGGAVVGERHTDRVERALQDKHAVYRRGVPKESADRVMKKAQTDPLGALEDLNTELEGINDKDRATNIDDAIQQDATQNAVETGVPRAVEVSEANGGGWSLHFPDGEVRHVKTMAEGSELLHTYDGLNETQRGEVHREIIDMFKRVHARATEWDYKAVRNLDEAVKQGRMSTEVAIERALMASREAGVAPALNDKGEVDLTKYGMKGNTRTFVQNGIQRIAISLARDARPEQVVEEGVEAYLQTALEQKWFTLEQADKWIDEVEAKRGIDLERKREGSEEVITLNRIEILSKMSLGYLYAEEEIEVLPTGLRKYLKVFREMLTAALNIARDMRALKESGELPSELERHIRRATGLDPDYQNEEERAQIRKQINEEFFGEEGAAAAEETINSAAVEPLNWSKRSAPVKFDPPRTKGGKMKGAPKNVNTPGDLRKMRNRLKKLAEEGAIGRYWYERSGSAVLRLFDGDILAAERFIELIAIYSPQATVDTNTTFAVRAWEQWATGVPADQFKVSTENRDGKAIEVLYKNAPWKGRKTDNFYKNLMFQILREVGHEGADKLKMGADLLEEIMQPVTVDMWVYRALGFQSDSLTDEKGTGAFGFAEREIQRLTWQLNDSLLPGEEIYYPHQVQAMIWTGIKNRTERKEIKEATEKASIKAGDMRRDGAQRIFTDNEAQQRHFDRWLTNAMKDKEAPDAITMDFSDYLDTLAMTATWEALPSTDTAAGEAISKLSHEEKEKFTLESRSVIIDENGRDLLAEKLGIGLARNEQSTGGYAGGIAPNILSTLTPNKPNGAWTDDKIRAYARAIQYIFRQDAVPWSRKLRSSQTKAKSYYVPNASGKPMRSFATLAEAQEFAAKKEGREVHGYNQSLGLRIEFDHALSNEELQEIEETLAAIHEDLGFTQVESGAIEVVNFRLDYQNMTPALTEDEFTDKVRDAYGNQSVKGFWVTGEYGPIHNWQEDPRGSGLLGDVAGFTSELQEWADDRRAEAEEIAARFSSAAIDLTGLGREHALAPNYSAPEGAGGRRVVSGLAENEIVHFSNRDDKVAIHARPAGTRGSESKIYATYPEVYTNRAYFGLNGYGVETNVGIPADKGYKVPIHPDLFYDHKNDPLDLRTAAREKAEELGYAPMDRTARTEIFHGLVRDAGFVGVKFPQANAGILYHDVPFPAGYPTVESFQKAFEESKAASMSTASVQAPVTSAPRDAATGFYSAVLDAVLNLEQDSFVEIGARTVPGKVRPAKTIRHPKTGEVIKEIPEKKEEDTVYEAVTVREQVYEAIRKADRVTAAEMNWLGIDTWLEGRKEVTTNELAAYVAAEQLTLVEHVKGDELGNTEAGRNQREYKKWKEQWSRNDDLATKLWGEMQEERRAEERDWVVLEQLQREYDEAERLRDEAMAKMEELRGRAAESTHEEEPTRHHDYTQKGDEHAYAEVLLTLPPKTQIGRGYHVSFLNAAHWHEENVVGFLRLTVRVTDDGRRTLFIEELQSDWASEVLSAEGKLDKATGKKGSRITYETSPAKLREARDKAEALRDELEGIMRKRAAIREEKGVPFVAKGGRRYTARVRPMRGNVDAVGVVLDEGDRKAVRAFDVEELEEGRSGEYTGFDKELLEAVAEPLSRVRKLDQEFREKRIVWLEANEQARSINSGEPAAIRKLHAKKKALEEKVWDVGAEERDALENEINDLDEKIRAAEKAVRKAPPMPFVRTYHELLLKRAIRIAAEGGFDLLAWASGKQQIDLWSSSMRQNVDRIRWSKPRPVTEEWTAKQEAKVAELESAVHEARKRRQEARQEEQEALSAYATNATPETEERLKAAKKAAKVAEVELGNLIDEHRNRWELYQKLKDGQGKVHLIASNEGNTVLDKMVPLEGEIEIEGNEVTLDGIVGAEMAKKIRESEEETGNIEGDDLSVGGHFHRQQYDVKFPQWLRKFVKRNGGTGEILEVNFEGLLGENMAIEITNGLSDAALAGFSTFAVEAPGAHKDLIDAVNEKLDQPVDRLTSYKKAIEKITGIKERWAARTLERTLRIMEGRAKGDGPVATTERDDLVTDLMTLEALAHMLPKEVRYKIGGAAQLARLPTFESRLTFLLSRVEKIDGVMSDYLVKHYGAKVLKIAKNARDKKNSAGVSINTIGPEAAAEAAEVYRILNLTKEEYAIEMERVEQAMHKEGLSYEEAAELDRQSWRLQTYGDLQSKGAINAESAYKSLQDLVKKGRDAWTMIREARAEEDRKRVEQALQDSTGGRGLKKSREALDKESPEKSGDLTGMQKIKAKMIRNLGNFHLFMQSWEWLLNAATRANTSVGTLGAETVKYFSRLAHVATHQANRGITARQELFSKDMARIFQIDTSKVGWRMKLSRKIEALKTRNVKGIFREEGGKTLSKSIPLEVVEKAFIEESIDLKDLGYSEREIADIKEAFEDWLNVESTAKLLKYETRTDGEMVEQALSQDTIIFLTMMYRQEHYTETMEFWGYTPEVMAAMEEKMTPEAKAIREWLSHQYDLNYTELNRVYRRIYGTNMPRTKNYAPGRSKTEHVKEDNLMDTQMERVSMSPTMVRGRVSHKYEPDNTREALTVFMQHAAQSEHFIAWAEPIRQMRAVFGKLEVRQAIEQYGSAKLNQLIQSKIDWFSEGGNRNAQQIAVFDHLRKTFTVTALSYNMGVFIKQLTSLGAYLYDMPTKAFLKYETYFLLHPKEVITKMMKLPYVKERWKSGWNRDVMLVLSSQNYGKRGRLQAAAEFGMITGKTGDIIPIMIGGYAAYRHAEETALKQGLGPSEAARRAEIAFEMATDRAQQAGNEKDLSYVQTGGSIARLFTMFLTTPRQYYSNTYEALADAFAGKKGAKKDFAKRLFIGHVLLPTCFTFASHLWRQATDLLDGDDEEGTFAPEDYFAGMLLGPLNGMFLLGHGIKDIAVSISGGRPYGYSVPVLEFLQHFGQAAYKGYKVATHDAEEDGPLDAKDFLEIPHELARGITLLYGKGAMLYDIGTRQARSLGVSDNIADIFDSSTDVLHGKAKNWGDEQEAKEPEDEEEETEPLTYEEKKIKGLGVKNGARAYYIEMKARRLPSGEREAWLDALSEKGILTPQVEEKMLTIPK